VTPQDATLAFCRRYGFNLNYLHGPDRYTVAGAADDFDGRVNSIAILRNGRFGNIVLQLLHASMLARQLRIEQIYGFTFQGGPNAGTIETPGLRFCFADGRTDAAPKPTLVGEFFNSYAFQSALSGLHADFVADTISTCLLPLFADRLASAEGDAQEAVLHFRSGDIFDAPPTSIWYVQPPAAFYVSAFRNLRERGYVRRARLVFEDRRNPAVDAVEAALRAEGVPVALTDGTFDADLSALVGARHIVSSFSTFTEAAALLSPRLVTYSAFRSLESHAHLHEHRPVPLFEAQLRLRSVRMFLFRDTDDSFIAPLDWRNTQEQRHAIVTFNAELLTLTEMASPVMTGERALLANTTDEALNLRNALVAEQARTLQRWNFPSRLVRWWRSRGQRHKASRSFS